MPSDEMTIGELSRNLHDLRTQIATLSASIVTLQASINASISSLPYIRSEIADVRFLGLEGKIAEEREERLRVSQKIEARLDRAYQFAVTGLLFPIVVGTLFLIAQLLLKR